jgi:hypothetical protein
MALSVLRQSNFLRRNALFSNISIKQISTSQPRTIHPLVTLFAQPISTAAAAILGLSARAFWKKLPESKKDFFKIQASKYRWLGIPGKVTKDKVSSKSPILNPDTQDFWWGHNYFVYFLKTNLDFKFKYKKTTHPNL